MSVQLITDIAAVAIATAGNNRKNQQARLDVAQLAALALVNLPNSRQAESEADKLGIELAAKAGYHPHAAVTLWKKMSYNSGDKSHFDFLSTHPASPKRIEALAELVPPMLRLMAESNGSHHQARDWTKVASNVRFVDDEKPNDSVKLATSLSSTPLSFYSEDSDRFKNGKIELTCKGECYAQHLINQGSLKRLYEEKSWRELSRKIINNPYKIDVAYYYLGAAAEGMGYQDSSKVYFDKASELSNSIEYSCSKSTFLSCNGMQIPSASLPINNNPNLIVADSSIKLLAQKAVPINEISKSEELTPAKSLIPERKDVEIVNKSAEVNNATPLQKQVKAIASIGVYAYEAEHLAKALGCNTNDGARPVATLIELTSTLEVYKLNCTNINLSVKCEYRICSQ